MKSLNSVVESFRPQMLFSSAGFDAHWNDPITSLGLSTRGYYEMSKKLVEIICSGIKSLFFHISFIPFCFIEKLLLVHGAQFIAATFRNRSAVLAFYIHDAVVIGYQLNTPWLFHYMSIINVVHFLDHFSFHLYLWRDRGRHEAEIEHANDKLRMAHELHDVVGAELSQMVVLSRELESGKSRNGLSRLAAGALEKIRDFAHILKDETEVDALPVILDKLRARLKLVVFLG